MFLSVAIVPLISQHLASMLPWCACGAFGPAPSSGRANDLQHVAGVWEAQRSFCRVREP